jgi:hypothetical protein
VSKTIRGVVLAVACALVACSSAGSPSSIGGTGDAAPDDGGGSIDGSSHDGGAGTDGSSAGDASSSSDSASSDGSLSDASNPLAPHPPPGSTKCGHGTFTQSDWSTGCMTPSWVLDMALQADGGFGTTPRDCTALTIASCQWEAWCTASDTYLWARFDQLSNSGTWVDCHNASLLWVDEGVYDTGSSGGNGAHVGTFEMDGTQIVGTTPGMPQIGILEVNVGNGPNGGAAKLFVLGSLENTCNMGAPGPPTVLGGISVSWTAH